MAVREILFRGKSLFQNEWVYGSRLLGVDYFGNNVTYIYPDNTKIDSRSSIGNYEGQQVYSNTVCQWTGLVDKNGVKIFEGDVMHNAGNVVEYCFGSFCINGDSPLSFWTGTEVIGDIYNNPELVKPVSE